MTNRYIEGRKNPPPGIDRTTDTVFCPERSHIFLQIELDALCQRQFGRVVDGVGLPAHVGLPGIRATLTPASGFLFAAEGPADLGPAGADVHHSDLVTNID